MSDARYSYRATTRFLFRVNRWPAGRVAAGPSPSPEEILADPDVDLAVRHAAPGLHAWARGAESGSGASPTKLLSLQRYLLRAHTRPTPFGLFSAVGTGVFQGRGEPTASMVPRVDRTRIHVRPDLGLVMSIARDAPATAYRTNDLVRRDADRLYLPGVFAVGRHEDRAARVRATPAVVLVLDSARSAARTRTDLAGIIAARYPDVDPARIDRVIRELAGLGFLIPYEQPRLSRFDDAPGSPWSAYGGEEAATLDSLSGVIPADDRTALESLLARGDRIARRRSHDGHAVEVHVGLPGASGTLPASVGAAIADAATFLSAVSPGAGDAAVSNQQAMTEYHRLFLERFGYGSAVRLADLLDPVRGLGSLGDAIDETGRTVRELTAYEWVLHDLLTTALHSGAPAIVIDSEVEARLRGAVPDVDSHPLQPSIDVFVQIAEDRASPDGCRVVLNHAPVAEGGSSFGRFAHLLDPETRSELAQLRRFALSTPRSPTEELQVSYLPQNARAGNVAVAPATGHHLLAVNAADGDDTSREVTLDDLWVVADYERLLIWSRRLGREVHLTQSHMLTAQLAPDIVQLALQIGAVRRRPVGGFSWGPFERSVRLPRVERAGVVIRAAEWTISVADHLDTTDEASLRRSLSRWRNVFGVPARVYDVQDDNRLLLDLDTDFAESHLRAQARRRQILRLQEVLPAPEQQVIRDEHGERYAAEFVVPVRLSAGSRGRVALTHRPAPPWATVSSPHYVDDPLATRAGWNAFHLYTPSRLDEMVLARLQEAFEHNPLLKRSVDRWYFVRYRDRRSHLRIRARSRPGREADLRAGIHAFHRELRRGGSSSDLHEVPYRPEYGRYAPADLFDRFEALFGVESDVVAGSSGILDAAGRRVLAVGIMSMYVRVVISEESERRSFIETMRSEAISREDREYVRGTMPLLSRAISGAYPVDDDASLHVLSEAAPALRDAISGVAASLDRDGARLTARAEGVLRSVLHMTCNRVLPAEGDEERRANDIWWLASRRLRGTEIHERSL